MPSLLWYLEFARVPHQILKSLSYLKRQVYPVSGQVDPTPTSRGWQFLLDSLGEYAGMCADNSVYIDAIRAA